MKVKELRYQKEDHYVPIPENERKLPTVEAEPFVEVPMDKSHPETNILEGLNFDKNDNLYICCPPHGDIYRVNLKDKKAMIFKAKVYATLK